MGPRQDRFHAARLGPGTAGSNIPNVAVSVEDSNSNVVTSQNTGSIAMTIASVPGEPSPSEHDQCKCRKRCRNFQQPRARYGRLLHVHRDTDWHHRGDDCHHLQSFTVSSGSGEQADITTAPASSITAGGTVSMSVTVEDTFGNTITTGNTGSTDTIKVTLHREALLRDDHGRGSTVLRTSVVSRSPPRGTTPSQPPIRPRLVSLPRRPTRITVNPASANHFVLSARPRRRPRAPVTT